MKTLTIPIPPELENSVPLVLYFPTRAEADEFTALMLEAKPNLVAQPIDVPGRDVTKELFPEGPFDLKKIEDQERRQHESQRRMIERRRGNNQY